MTRDRLGSGCVAHPQYSNATLRFPSLLASTFCFLHHLPRPRSEPLCSDLGVGVHCSRMHATLVPVHPTTPWRNSIHCKVIGKPSIFIDFGPLIARFKASSYNWSGNRSTDMPKTHENRSPKPHKSSNTRASPNLAVRQAPVSYQTSLTCMVSDKNREPRATGPRHLGPKTTGEEARRTTPLAGSSP